MSNVANESFDNTIASGTVLVDFWAQWCGYCRMLGPILDEFKTKYEGEVKVVKINVEEDNDLANRYDITSLPTIIAFKNGKEVDRKLGMQTIESLEEMIAN